MFRIDLYVAPKKGDRKKSQRLGCLYKTENEIARGIGLFLCSDSFAMIDELEMASRRRCIIGISNAVHVFMQRFLGQIRRHFELELNGWHGMLDDLWRHNDPQGSTKRYCLVEWVDERHTPGSQKKPMCVRIPSEHPGALSEFMSQQMHLGRLSV